MADEMDFEVDGPTGASAMSEEQKEELRKALKDALEKELQDETGGISAAGHGKGSIKWAV